VSGELDVGVIGDAVDQLKLPYTSLTIDVAYVGVITGDQLT